MSFLNRFLPTKPIDDTLASVVRNLLHILNAKAGYGSPLCDFGLGEYYAQLSSQQSADAVMREIMAHASAYEPRLRVLGIRLLGDRQLPLCFELRGELSEERGRPLAPRYELVPCKLAIALYPNSGAVLVHPLNLDPVERATAAPGKARHVR